MWKEAKYLIAYVTPLSAFLGVYLSGQWSYAAILVTFLLLPLLEMILPPRPENVTGDKESVLSSRRFFDWLLYLNLPIVYFLCGFLAYRFAFSNWNVVEIVGMTLGVGIVLGTCGINVAHELGHRESGIEQIMARILLAPTMYTHFTLEHNFGHHKHVATPDDPATARLGESIFHFWIRSIGGSFANAWKLQRRMLDRAGASFWSLSNSLLQGLLFQIGYLLWIWLFFGPGAVLVLLVASIVGILLLESVNYIEHYGLVRTQLPSGRYEPVNPTHSWNSDHQLGRIFLYELTRHSDHHYESTRKYQLLRHMDESPQLPFGYPASIILALVPPVWMRLMDSKCLGANR